AASVSTTTPRCQPGDGATPQPITWTLRLRLTSATSVVTLVVPGSMSTTIRSLAKYAPSCLPATDGSDPLGPGAVTTRLRTWIFRGQSLLYRRVFRETRLYSVGFDGGFQAPVSPHLSSRTGANYASQSNVVVSSVGW